MRAHLAWILAVMLVALVGWYALRRLPERGTELPAEQETVPEASTPRLLGAAPQGETLPGAKDAEESGSVEDGVDEAAAWQEEHPLEVGFFDAESGRALNEVGSTVLVRHQANTTIVEIRIDVPPGYVAWDRYVFTHHDVPWAPRLRIRYPLRRELGVEVTLRRLDGRLLEMPRLLWGLEGMAWIPTPVDGESARIRGVPFFRGQNVRIDATDRGAEGSMHFAMPATSAARVSVSVELEPDTWSLIEDEEIADHVETDNDLPLPPSDDPPPPGTVEVAVFRNLGSPAAGVPVRLGRRSDLTDASGLARFLEVAVGEHEASVRTPGLLPLSANAYVESERTTRVELRESVGVTIAFEVVDAAGRPLPFAGLQLMQDSGIPWQDVEGDTLRLDHFTDEFGRRRLAHVEPGLIRCAARWGGWVKRGTVRARDGETHALRLVLGE